MLTVQRGDEAVESELPGAVGIGGGEAATGGVGGDSEARRVVDAGGTENEIDTGMGLGLRTEGGDEGIEQGFVRGEGCEECGVGCEHVDVGRAEMEWGGREIGSV